MGEVWGRGARWAGPAVVLSILACGNPTSPSGGGFAGGDGGSLGDATGNGAASLNVTQCDPRKGWLSAVRSTTGAKDPATLAGFAEALRDAGYTTAFHPGSADAGSEPDAAADPDAAAGDDAATTGADAAAADPGLFAVGVDQRDDTVFLLANGDLVVASACPLDRLGQVRRLDFALAAAARALTSVDQPGDWQLETARWVRPEAWYGTPAGVYWRHYLGDGTDLQKPLQGTLSLAATPVGLALGVYGHADAPSKVGDVVRMNLLEVAGKKLAVGETWLVHDVAAVVWDLAAAMAAGELPFTAELLVADASVEWKVGTYRVFFEALFANAGGGLGVSLQGTLPGALRVSRPMSELELPLAPTET